jgi:hypothetical protein
VYAYVSRRREIMGDPRDSTVRCYNESIRGLHIFDRSEPHSHSNETP